MAPECSRAHGPVRWVWRRRTHNALTGHRKHNMLMFYRRLLTRCRKYNVCRGFTFNIFLRDAEFIFIDSTVNLIFQAVAYHLSRSQRH